jgi:manganese transport protein
VPQSNASFWQNWRAFAGPGFLVSVGYMDPGNWATDLEAGATYRYDLLWVVALSSVVAIIMQLHAARLGVVTGKDLAQACRDYYPSWTRWPNWLSCEAAIAACDLAELLGSAVALHLLFDIPLLWGLVITALDVLILLALRGMGMRIIESLILVLIFTIAVCYWIELFVLPKTRPDFLEIGRAICTPGLRDGGMIVLAIGIIGATVMPHNLYLHSALVQSRRFRSDDATIRRAIRFNTIDTVVALTAAFCVNAAILVLAATVFHGRDKSAFGEDPDWIQMASDTLAPLLGTAVASTLFAVALLASGQSSTITGTLAGQVVMEGFMHWRMRPWLRRLVTRLVAIVPAILIVSLRPETRVNDLLILSQLVLALQLPLAMIPLLHFSGSRRRMKAHASGKFLLIAGWIACAAIIALEIYSLPKTLQAAWTVIVGK